VSFAPMTRTDAPNRSGGRIFFIHGIKADRDLGFDVGIQ